MGFLKIAGNSVTIAKMGNMMDFFTSMTGSAYDPKYFEAQTSDGKKFKLAIISVQKEDGSGSKFLFTATGYVEHPEKKDVWVPIAGNLEGFVNF